jgi:hypothetical protein
MRSFREIKPVQIEGNPIHLIGQEWMLITAGTPDHFNTMTASWGSIGELWFKPVCFCFVRPQRYTYELMEKSDVFTLSFSMKNTSHSSTFAEAVPVVKPIRRKSAVSRLWPLKMDPCFSMRPASYSNTGNSIFKIWIPQIFSMNPS